MTDRAVARVARALADQQSDRLADVPQGRDVVVSVTVVSPLTVSWRGASVTANRLAAYTSPTVGDRVLCRLVDNQLIVLGKIV